MELRCRQCGKLLPDCGAKAVQVNINGQAGCIYYHIYCRSCAGFNGRKKRFRNREDYIRESVPDAVANLPVPVLADWCSEHGRDKDAAFLYKLASETSGDPTSSKIHK